MNYVISEACVGEVCRSDECQHKAVCCFSFWINLFTLKKWKQRQHCTSDADDDVNHKKIAKTLFGETPSDSVEMGYLAAYEQT